MFTMFLLSCVHVSDNRTSILVNNSSQLTYKGKGAGAGMMLMSAMGPMGIAIGVAIDEGIAKDIRTAADNGQFSIANVIEQEFGSVDAKLGQVNIDVESYGYIAKIGQDDLAIPQIRLKITAKEVDKVYAYPEEFPDSSYEGVELDKLKQNADAIDLSMRTAIKEIVIRFLSDIDAM
ncbi:hypothetical protein [Teredinibacter sp. KSP-S5-2]|uniref:hypothetical protein n=1 Tax=Teredinibacter sp. KSP-S5-2 TaxID=3034506 RepID=UPI0029351A73|nr:hypothetical protein [Teredinibacter sp. KSP-S5-2]WNO11021.1 hypothetical protein P5V12_07510 [Teredinibacter sp. KSP-S5-2]